MNKPKILLIRLLRIPFPEESDLSRTSNPFRVSNRNQRPREATSNALDPQIRVAILRREPPRNSQEIRAEADPFPSNDFINDFISNMTRNRHFIPSALAAPLGGSMSIQQIGPDDHIQINFRRSYISDYTTLRRLLFPMDLRIVFGNIFSRLNQFSITNQQQPRVPTEEAVNGLERVTISESHQTKNSETGKNEYPNCTVCLNDMKISDEAIYMPCRHLFHKDCLLPWLQSNYKCPTCRHELPTS
ncbi:unnamed protein product [Moneuplotes crassus]|uniref:RING-type domain-containing protein n=1 Tax=Euplotes crassus TaxID=5936 RepID=A0AAD1XJ46_EUPCR|nr:unnamed protein product [Moneuplotes crassus]